MYLIKGVNIGGIKIMKYSPRRYDLFDDMFDDFFGTAPVASIMKTDIHEKDGYYTLDVELPGYKKEDINMEIANGYLTIKAKHEVNDEEKEFLVVVAEFIDGDTLKNVIDKKKMPRVIW